MILKIFKKISKNFAVMLLFLITADAAHAAIFGVEGTVFNFTAKEGCISTPDGGSYLMWGYALDTNQMQYPGPTLIINQGDTITVNLTNTLIVPVSIVFPGQTGVAASGGVQGLITREALPLGGTVSYTFTASHAGTYIYYSGTSPELQIEMGMVGAIIVRPTGFMHHMPQAYEHIGSAYSHGREFLFLFTEMDPKIHEQIALGRLSQVDTTTRFPVLWFINGRCAPDTMAENFDPLLPHQPYNCMPMMHPGDKVLMRIVSAGKDPHPFHTHGNNFNIIARDGRLLESEPNAGPDLAVSNFTITVTPGGTAEAIFEWTGAHLGWDIYGHDINDPLEPNEYAPDHGKPFPVTLPTVKELTIGNMWSGSPFLGAMGSLPPGKGTLNPNGGYTFMWHSHNEKEMTNYDIFPGGLMTMLIIEAPSVPIMEH